MTTATIPAALKARFEAEVAEARETERAAAIAELQEIREALTTKIPPLTQAVTDAEANYLKVTAETEAMMLAATNELNAARSKRSEVDRPLCARRDALERMLTVELAHPAITEALAKVDRVSDENRTAVGRIDAKQIAGISNWCTSARENLNSLLFQQIDDTELAVEAIMDTQR